MLITIQWKLMFQSAQIDCKRSYRLIQALRCICILLSHVYVSIYRVFNYVQKKVNKIESHLLSCRHSLFVIESKFLWFISEINHAVQNLFLISFKMSRDILKWDFDITNSLFMFSNNFVMILLQRHWESSLLQDSFMKTSFRLYWHYEDDV